MYLEPHLRTKDINNQNRLKLVLTGKQAVNKKLFYFCGQSFVCVLRPSLLLLQKHRGALGLFALLLPTFNLK